MRSEHRRWRGAVLPLVAALAASAPAAGLKAQDRAGDAGAQPPSDSARDQAIFGSSDQHSGQDQGGQDQSARDQAIFGSGDQHSGQDQSAQDQSARDQAIFGSGDQHSGQDQSARDAAIFGSANQPSAQGGSARDEAVLGSSATPMFDEPAAPSDPLTIGGQLYLRTQTTALADTKVADYGLRMPILLDVYFDARPNDRVRGFVLGRMSYDPLLPPESSEPAVSGTAAIGGVTGSPMLSSLLAPQTSAPHVLLDQIWLSFDVSHRVFITAGRQHVRWGTGRFWSPTDFLHLRRRNPLDVFDARTGTTMLKLQLPIESKAWNFYAYGITEGLDAEQPTWSTPAGAARAEFVFDSTELGLGVFGRPHTRAKFAADISSGIGDFDVYGELAVINPRNFDRVRFVPDATIPAPPQRDSWESDGEYGARWGGQIVSAIYPAYRERGYRPQAVVGFTYSHKYNDNDVFTIGGEYFYNGLGYADSEVYPGLILPHSVPLQSPASFFYLGKHYAALFVTFPAPFSLDLHTFTLSTLGNLSDRSFITRLDYSLVLLTHLRLEAYASARYGRGSGEFRLGVKPPAINGVPFFRPIPPAIFDLGLALRLAI